MSLLLVLLVAAVAGLQLRTLQMMQRSTEERPFETSTVIDAEIVRRRRRRDEGIFTGSHQAAREVADEAKRRLDIIRGLDRDDVA